MTSNYHSDSKVKVSKLSREHTTPEYHCALTAGIIRVGVGMMVGIPAVQYISLATAQQIMVSS